MEKAKNKIIIVLISLISVVSMFVYIYKLNNNNLIKAVFGTAIILIMIIFAIGTSIASSHKPRHKQWKAFRKN